MPKSSEDIAVFRSKIMRLLTTNTGIVNLMGSTLERAPIDLPYKYISPYQPVKDLILKTDKFINYNIRMAIDPRNNVYKDVTVYFWVCCHFDIVRTPTGLWYDEVVKEIDSMFGEQDILGVGDMTLSYLEPYAPVDGKFLGELITFKTKSFTNGSKYTAY